ncbi:unnamed protein product [Tetraodon nigroviridis]|uniref:(spotted green pufferfish) hypothetical protein n=1 Tax=Tetraodon nigroviridis TaxID=99883 RepID=Q4RFX5_TETNG|nr:unnamed protein product [Tetraodon nigroviridis]
MSRLLSLSLLLIILAELYSSAALRPNFKVSKAHIRKCRCQVLAGGKMRCPLSRGKPITQQELHNCFCGKANRHSCFALCCLPVFTCKVTSAAGACPCLPLLDCIGCVPPASLAMRASVRQRYGIPHVRLGNAFVYPCWTPLEPSLL